MSNQGQLKNFYPLSEFYSFIKSPGNTPMPQSFATAVPLTCGALTKADKALFSYDNLYKFALSINTCAIPHTTFGSDSLSIKNTYGVYETLSTNSNIFPDKQTTEIKFIETSNSVIETFIYPWMLACLNSHSGLYSYPFPRLDLAIKLYRSIDFCKPPAEKKGESITIKPYIVYWFEGIFPENIEHIGVDHNEVNASHTTRGVTFRFNSFMCFPNEFIAGNYGFTNLFEGVTWTPPKPKDDTSGKNSAQDTIKKAANTTSK
jgi:hypothetical protein